jgi:adenylylsulfate kinase
MSWALWITGLPGSGKSVLARGAAARLEEAGVPVHVLELDVVRRFVTPVPTYSTVERDLVYRALVYMATALVDAGVPVIIDATGHRREWRDLARASIARFAEVQLECPLEVCRAREQRRTEGHAPRGIYARAGRPGATVPGVDVTYEEALAPELRIDTAREDPQSAVARIVVLADELGAEAEAPGPPRAPCWVLWITGLPGSGKTTIAWSVAEALAARGVPVRVLELAELRHVLLGDRPESDAAREIVHRALAYTAKLLADAGVAVIVDATAPRRAWRELARELIARFAEVQLVCPPEICHERERAARWRLGGGLRAPAAARPASEAPEIVLDYEPALRPELVLHTDVRDIWTAVEEVLRLANRLHREEAL